VFYFGAMSYRTLELQLWRTLGSLGGNARAKTLSPSERRKIAAMGGRASKGKPKKRRKKTKK
jgi:hypothetical protein